MSKFANGTVEGTGAAITIDCGFIPTYIKLMNIDGLATMEWTSDFTDAYGLKTVTDGTISLVTSAGITPLSVDTTLGFTIGADTDVNVTSTAETIMWIAMA